MASRPLKIGLLAALVVAGAAGILALRRDNERLSRRAADLHRQREQIARLHDENARARGLATATAESAGSAAALHTELLRLRGEVAELEGRGLARQAQATANATTLATNRDPEKDFVLVENFSNVGRGTPSAAFQTLVWAATKGDDQSLANLLTIDRNAREQIDGILAALPDPARAKYPNAESVAGLFFANLITGHTAARVLGQDMTDMEHATVTIAFERMPVGRPMAARWGPDGWQLAVTDEMAGEFQRQMTRTSGLSPKK